MLKCSSTCIYQRGVMILQILYLTAFRIQGQIFTPPPPPPRTNLGTRVLFFLAPRQHRHLFSFTHMMVIRNILNIISGINGQAQLNQSPTISYKLLYCCAAIHWERKIFQTCDFRKVAGGNSLGDLTSLSVWCFILDAAAG